MCRGGISALAASALADLTTAPLPAASVACAPDALCLFEGRFKVEVDWRTPDGRTGRGMAVPGPDPSGYFCIFTEAFFRQFGHIRDYPLFQPGSTPVFALSGEQATVVAMDHRLDGGQRLVSGEQRQA